MAALKQSATSIFDINLRTGVVALILAAVSAATVMAAPSAQAQTYQLIHDFSGPDGAHPSALVMDAAGHLYGATQNGGTGAACQGGCGVVFRLTHSGSGWVETPLYSFTGCSDGAVPSGGLVLGPDGSLYGTTQVGGSACGGGWQRYGV
jgi:hypothetical protein